MKINELIKYLDDEVISLHVNNRKAEIKFISFDSRSVAKGSAFFAFKGESFDSHEIAEALYRAGDVSLVVAERELGKDIEHIVVRDGRVALSLASSLYFGEPLKKYKSVAITGTNGKTTTSYILDSIFAEEGANTVKIGTVGTEVAGNFIATSNTTPSAYEVNSILSDGLSHQCEYLSMEVSSHALAQGRVAGLKFDVAIFTNLTGDHLDYHKDMDSYFKAKKLLFKNKMSKHKVINIGTKYGSELAKDIKKGLYTFAVDKKADVYPTSYSFTVDGITAQLSILGKKFKRPLRSNLIGHHNLENILGALTAALIVGIDLDTCLDGIENMQNVAGRLEKFSNNGVTAFVDYAHTDDALVNVITAVRKVATGRIITVFGAGGDRDKSKRPRMAKAVTELSDVAVITSDNPRTEDPIAIIDDIKTGISGDKCAVIVEVDREKAIAQAIDMAEQGDVVLVAGKGHEDYQIIGSETIDFDDRLIVQKYL